MAINRNKLNRRLDGRGTTGAVARSKKPPDKRKGKERGIRATKNIRRPRVVVQAETRLISSTPRCEDFAMYTTGIGNARAWPGHARRRSRNEPTCAPIKKKKKKKETTFCCVSECPKGLAADARQEEARTSIGFSLHFPR